MLKIFSVNDANDLIPIVDNSLSQIKEHVQDTLDLRDDLEKLSPNSVEALNKMQEISFILQDIHKEQFELFKLGVFVEDFEDAQVVFPSQIGAEVVFLAHKLGQDEITHYHRLSDTKQYSLKS